MFKIQYLREQFLRIIVSYEATYVDINERSHKKLAVKPIHNSPMSRYNISEILKAHRMLFYNIFFNSSVFITLILKARLKPDAKKPPNGPMTLLKILKDKEWSANGYIITVGDMPI